MRVLEPALAGRPGLITTPLPLEVTWGRFGLVPGLRLSDLFVSVQLEEQLSRLQREKNEIQNRLEEDQEDMNELMKKHKAAVAQVPCPGVPTTPRATGTALWSPSEVPSTATSLERLQCLRPLALWGGWSRVDLRFMGGPASALTPFPGLPGPGSDE